MIFDSHAHYDDKRFDGQRHELLISMKENGIGKIVNVGASLEGCRSTLELAAKYEFIYGALGIHPSDVGDLNEESFRWIKERLQREAKMVALGEIGLDYYWEKESDAQNLQKLWFRRQLALAREVGLPVIIHSRDAAADTMEIMKEHTASLKKENALGKPYGIIHCFSYSVEQAREYVAMGYEIGIGGVITFKNARKLKEVVEEIPMERMVIETDCPYLSPEPNRGKRNDSRNLCYVVDAIAELKGLTPGQVEEISFRNACQVYRMKES